jgi:glutathione S-transferase
VLRFQKHYLKKSDHEIDPNLPKRCASVLALMNNHLAARRYFVGEKLSLADVALVAYTRFAPHAGLDLALYSHISPWIGRVERDLKLARNG